MTVAPVKSQLKTPNNECKDPFPGLLVGWRLVAKEKPDSPKQGGYLMGAIYSLYKKYIFKETNLTLLRGAGKHGSIPPWDRLNIEMHN